jgi:hypothetical protein
MEWKVTAGVWALGLGVLTVGLKIALPVLSGAPSLSTRCEAVRLKELT